MFTTNTRIRLYRRTIGCRSLLSQHTVSGHYRPIVASLKNFAHKDSDQTAQSDARLYQAST